MATNNHRKRDHNAILFLAHGIGHQRHRLRYRQMDQQAAERKLRKKVEAEERKEAVAAYEAMRAALPKKPPPLPAERVEQTNSARRALIRDLIEGTVGDTAAIGRDGLRREDASPFGVRRVWRPRRRGK